VQSHKKIHFITTFNHKIRFITTLRFTSVITDSPPTLSTTSRNN
jgi:hypothetical protein